jgi:hypothetical protein
VNWFNLSDILVVEGIGKFKYQKHFIWVFKLAMEAIFEFIFFIVGQVILESVGSFSIKVWFYIKSIFREPEIRKKRKIVFDGVIDLERFENQFVGFVVVAGVIAVFVKFFLM